MGKLRGGVDDRLGQYENIYAEKDYKWENYVEGLTIGKLSQFDLRQIVAGCRPFRSSPQGHSSPSPLRSLVVYTRLTAPLAHDICVSIGGPQVSRLAAPRRNASRRAPPQCSASPRNSTQRSFGDFRHAARHELAPRRFATRRGASPRNSTQRSFGDFRHAARHELAAQRTAPYRNSARRIAMPRNDLNRVSVQAIPPRSPPALKETFP
jgi:hypothetical protein